MSVVAARDYAYIEPDEPAKDGRNVAMLADGPVRATLVPRLVVEGGGHMQRAANRGRPDMEVACSIETMICGVAVFVGRAV